MDASTHRPPSYSKIFRGSESVANTTINNKNGGSSVKENDRCSSTNALRTTVEHPAEEPGSVTRTSTPDNNQTSIKRGKTEGSASEDEEFDAESLTTKKSHQGSAESKSQFPWHLLKASSIRDTLRDLGVGSTGNKERDLQRLKQIARHGIDMFLDVLNEERAHKQDKSTLPSKPRLPPQVEEQYIGLRRSTRQPVPRRRLSSPVPAGQSKKTAVARRSTVSSPDVSVRGSPTPEVASSSTPPGLGDQFNASSRTSQMADFIQPNIGSISTWFLAPTLQPSAAHTSSSQLALPSDGAPITIATTGGLSQLVSSGNVYQDIIALLPHIIPFPPGSEGFNAITTFVLQQVSNHSDTADAIAAAPMPVKGSLISMLLQMPKKTP